MSPHPLIEDEEARHALWLQQQSNKLATRARIEAELAGSPLQRASLQGDYQTLIDYAVDRQTPDQGDEQDSRIVVNQDTNWP